MAPEVTAERARCGQCGLEIRVPARGAARPAGPLFCCFGCALVHEIAGARADRSAPPWILARLGLAAFLAMNVMAMSLVLYAGDPHAGAIAAADPLELGMAGIFRYVSLLFSGLVFVLLGWPILDRGIRDLRLGRGSVDTLIALGALGAFGLSAWATLRGEGAVYYETGCMILLLVTLGRFLEATARTRAAETLGALLSREPRHALVVTESGVVQREIASVRAGDRVRIPSGAAVPVDGTILEGEGGVDESWLTGESDPVRKARGDRLYAGSVAVDGAFDVETGAAGDDRAVIRIARLVESARASKAPIERTADRIASLFVPAAVAAAAGAGVVCAWSSGTAGGLMRALSVLLIACPCALGLATPLALWTALGRAARRGIVIRSGEAIERMASIRTIAFDKTGTLTTGSPRVAQVSPSPGIDEESLLSIAAALETASSHPIARALGEEAARRRIAPAAIREFRTHPGVGVTGEVGTADGWKPAAIGGREMFRRLTMTPPDGPEGRTWIALGGRIAGSIDFEEQLREGAGDAIASLADLGVSMTILTGDSGAMAGRLARALGIAGLGGLSPSGKLAEVASMEEGGTGIAMVGEGVNDAPALARASLSIAMGCGADAARDASDVTLLGEDLRSIPWLLALSRRTMRRVRINLFWAFVYNACLIPIAMAGLLQPVLAALAMLASSVFVVAGSLAPADSDGAGAAGEAPAGGRAIQEAWAR